MIKTNYLKFSFILLYLVFLLVVFYVRFQGIAIRPMHCDEANQAYKTGILLEKGIYKYDPHEHHGPLLYYATLPILYLYNVHLFKDTDETMFRIVPLLFSLLLFLALIPVKKHIGTIAFWVSSILLAVSHAFFFYSRYYVHEIPFVLFSCLFVFLAWYYLNNQNLLTIIFLGITLSLSFATKETTVIVLFSTCVSIMITHLFMSNTVGYVENVQIQKVCTFSFKKVFQQTLCFLIAFLIPWLFLYSSFFTNGHGLVDFFKAYRTYLFRASGEGFSGIHDKPWWYYLEILTYFNKTVGPVWSEGFILLLCAIEVISFLILAFRIIIKKKCTEYEYQLSSFCIFLFFSYFITFVIFSLIPYKTPWNVLFPLLGMIIFAGIGFQALWQRFRKAWSRCILLFILLLGTYHLGYQTYQGNYIYFADISNPYVYAHTSTSLVKMMNRIYELSDILKKEEREPIVFVVDSKNDYWPIPWYLRKIDRKGFWANIPSDINKVPFLIITPDLSQEVDKILGNTPYMKEIYSIRPGVFRYLYIEQPLWDKFIELQALKRI